MTFCLILKFVIFRKTEFSLHQLVVYTVVIAIFLVYLDIKFVSQLKFLLT